ncbi:hypothetical protein AL065_07235 [Pseudomonas amygdali pv. ulmi]|uniref:hypothetical protein n=1 Tax=Pseudomonas amygdali TaxID=47877 RepID=UPI000708E601|nr:hypothetical protein [Pseudomonas amygdali]KWS09530.1 hypothetical protein AL065_07235 [Pseudomonas amygdali pv. ulmi]
MRNYLQLLAEAAQHDSQRVVTGFLLDARPKGERIRAAIFSDLLNRFGDGEPFTTSRILETYLEGRYTLVVTESGSCYVIVSHMMFIEDIVDGVPQTVILRAS